MNPTAAELGYVPHLAATAARLGQRAADLRERAGLLDRASARCPWDGAGARAFRRRQHGATVRLRRCADLLDETARLLHVHGAAVADALAHSR